MFLCGRYRLPLDRPLLMGILNVTPDSFSDGGMWPDAQAAIAQGMRLKEEGADLLDIGGESTRPGALPVDEQEELRRVLPVIEGLLGAGIPLSVDTSKPAVMREAVRTGADMINDVNALLAPGAVEVAVGSNVGICLMHRQGLPASMQDDPRYEDVIGEVAGFLRVRAEMLIREGVDRGRICIDPGFGFGKTTAHNLMLLRHLDRLAASGLPVMVGISRKSMLGALTGLPVEDRLIPSVAAALIAVERGAKILRVHDVKATSEALKVWQAINNEEKT
jgi:dihydropteroate synthase